MVGNRLGPYRVLSCLGEGGMGSVYLAALEAPALGLPAGAKVALKLVHPHLRSVPEAHDRFRREAEIGSHIVHPNVVRTYGVESIPQDGDVVDVMVMEYVEGETLRKLAQTSSPLPEALCLHVGLEVAKGLAAIHAAGVVHRDVKPENVLVTTDHVVKVMDLGVALIADELRRLTITGDFIGSTQYAAPEQFPTQGEGTRSVVDGRADLYSLGLTLYEVATGAHPFAEPNLLKRMERLLREKARPAMEVNPALSPFFDEVVRWLVERDPEKRFPSAADLVQVLEQGERSLWWRMQGPAVRSRTKQALRRMRIRRDTRIQGRDTELARLREAFDDVKAGRGRVVLVEGEAGIGKTRLVDEFVEGLRSEQQPLQFLFGGYPPSDAATLGAFTTAFLEHFGEDDLENSLRRHLAGTPLLVPAFAAFLRGEARPAGTEPLPKDTLQTVFLRTVRSLAAQVPTILLVEDLHRAPKEGLALFAALAHAVAGDHVMLIGTARAGALPPAWVGELGKLEHTSRMTLARLGARDLAKLLVEAFGSEPLANELGFPIMAKSDGNPFFVFEILRELFGGGQLTRQPDGRWVRTAEIHEIRIPSTIVDLVQGRLEALEIEDRKLLEVAACYGFEFDATLVGEVLRLDCISALQRIDALAKTSRLVRAAGERYVFDHHQVHETLYNGLSQRLRRAYHAEIGKALDRVELAARDGETTVRICDHLLKGGCGAQALPHLGRAFDYLETAEAHERGFVHGMALGIADAALSTKGLLAGRDRIDVLLRKATRCDILGRATEEREALREALRIADDEARSADQGDGDEQERWVFISYSVADERTATSVREALEASGLRCWIASRDLLPGQKWAQRIAEAVAGARALVLVYSSRTSTSDYVLRELTAAARERVPIFVLRIESAPLSQDFQFLVSERQWLDASTPPLGKHLETLAAELRSAGSREDAGTRTAGRGLTSLRARARSSLGWHLQRAGEHAEASRILGESAELARRDGDRTTEGQALGNLSVALASLGRRDEARILLERCVEIFREQDDRRREALARGNVGNLLQAMGEYEDAAEHHRRALTVLHDAGDRRGVAVATGNLGTYCHAVGRYADAKRHFEEQLRISRQIGFRLGEALASINLGPLLAMLGAADEARKTLDGALALCREMPWPTGVGAAVQALGAVAAIRGDFERARAHFEEAMRIREPLGNRSMSAETYAALGGLWASRGSAEAKPLLAKALALAEDQSPGPRVLAAAYSALLDPNATAAARKDLETFGRRLFAHERLEATYVLWRATNEADLLAAARKLLDDLVAGAPAAEQDAMVRSVPVHRELRAQAVARVVH